MTQRLPGNIEIIELATAYRTNLSERENCEHENETVQNQPMREPIRDLEQISTLLYKIMEDESKLEGLETDESDDDLTTRNMAFNKLIPPPKIKKKKPSNPGMFFDHACKDIADVIKPFCENQPQRNDKKMIDESVRRMLWQSRAREDDSGFIVQHESNKRPTSPIFLKF